MKYLLFLVLLSCSNKISVGDLVKYKDGERFSENYQSCKSIKVLGIYPSRNVPNKNVAWVELKNCPGLLIAESFTTKLIPLEHLKK